MENLTFILSMKVLILLSTSNARIPAVLNSCSLGTTPELHCWSPGSLWHFLGCKPFLLLRVGPQQCIFRSVFSGTATQNFSKGKHVWIYKLKNTKDYNSDPLSLQRYALSSFAKKKKGKKKHTISLTMQIQTFLVRILLNLQKVCILFISIPSPG